MNGDQTHIVIVGGGFAGVHTARHLHRLSRGRAGVKITLVSRENYFLMTPLLFEAASGVLESTHAVNPIRGMFDGVRFIEANAEKIDLDRKMITARLAADQAIEIPYDHLVLALGGVTNRSIIPGSEHSREFKTLFDAISLRNHCIKIFEQADVDTSAEHKKTLLTMVIIGGGLVGLELMGEMTHFAENIRRSYPNVKKEEIRFELIEGGARLVSEMDPSLGEYAEEVLRKRGVNVRLNTRVDRIEPGKVFLPDSTLIESFTVIVATGVKGNPLVGELPVEKDKKGRMVVESTMRHKERGEVWALGDCAAIPDPQGHPYPTLAQHALREARTVAKNIIASLDGNALHPFVYKSKGTMAALGGFKGVGRVYKVKIHGFFAWWVWRTYYLMQMPRLNRKVRIMVDWTVSLIFKNDAVQLDMTKRT